MALRIRQATEADAPSLSRICLLTADAGKPAEHLHDYPELPSLIFSVPYVMLPATWAFVLEDQSVNEVVGYAVGSLDTRKYEQHAREGWFPTHAARYPSPKTTPNMKAADKSYIERLKNPDGLKASEVSVAFSPVHLHINILDKYQRQGWGRKMIRVAVDYLKEKGFESLWLGIDPRNEDAKRFYTKIGFRPMEGARDENLLGLAFAELK